MQTHLKLT